MTIIVVGGVNDTADQNWAASMTPKVYCALAAFTDNTCKKIIQFKVILYYPLTTFGQKIVELTKDHL
jgi:hypothetical protein